METTTSVANGRQSRGALRVPKFQRKVNADLDNMNNLSANPEDVGGSMKRKVESALDMTDLHVKLVRLSQNQIENWTNFNSEMMNHEVDSFQQLKLSDSTQETNHTNPKPIVDIPVFEMKDSDQTRGDDEHSTVRKKFKNIPKPKLNIQIAPLVKQTVLNKVKPVSVVSKMFNDKAVQDASKAPCDKVVSSKAPCDKVMSSKAPSDKVVSNKVTNGPSVKAVVGADKVSSDIVVPSVKGPSDKVVSSDKVVPSSSKVPSDKGVSSVTSAKAVSSVSEVSQEVQILSAIPTASRISDSSDVVIEVKPLAKRVPTCDSPKRRRPFNSVSGNVKSRNLGSVNNILSSESKGKLLVKFSPSSGKVVKRSTPKKNGTPKKSGNVKKLRLFWENFTVKARAVTSASTKPNKKTDDSASTTGETEQVTEEVQSDPQVPTTSQHDEDSQATAISQPNDTAEVPEPQVFKTPTKTPARKATPATPKSPQEVLQDYTKTVEVSKSMSPVSACKSSKLNKYPHEMEIESPRKWAKKSFRRLFPEPPVNEEPSPDALEVQKSRKKRSTRKRSLMSLDPSVYSQFYSPPPPADLDSSMITQRQTSNRSIEVSTSVPDDSFMVSDVSVEDSVTLPNQPSCVDSLNGVEMSSLISNVSELNSSVFDNSTVKRMITETATNVFGNNDSTLIVKDTDLEESVVIKGNSDVIPDSESSEEKESEVISGEIAVSDDLNSTDLDVVTSALVEELLNLSKASVNRETKGPEETPNENYPTSDPGPEDTAVNPEVPEILHHEEVVPMMVDDQGDDDYQELEDAADAQDATSDEPPPLFSTIKLDDLHPPVLSPHPSALETITSPYTQSSATRPYQDSTDDIPDLISPASSLKPPTLSPHPDCLEVLKSADKKVENMTYLLTAPLMPAVDFPQEMSMEPPAETAMNLTCYELHDKENIPVSTQSQETATFTANHFSPSYLSSSQLLWSPTPVIGSSPQPQVLSSRKSVKRPRKLVFDSNHDQSAKPPVPKRATPSKKQSERKERSSATLTQMARKTSSIGKLSQLISPRKSPSSAPVYVSSTSVEMETPVETPVLTHEKPSSATPVTSICASQTSLTVQPRSAHPVLQVPQASLVTSSRGPLSAGPVMMTSQDETTLMFHQGSGSTVMPPPTQQGVQPSQQFFGSDFVPTFTMERNSSVFWKKYTVGSMTYTRDVNLPVTTPDNQIVATTDVRNTPEGSETRGRQMTTYRIQSSQVQQYMTSTPVSTHTTSRINVQENSPIDVPVSTALQPTRPTTSVNRNTEDQFSFFDHLTNSVRDRLNQQLSQRRGQAYGETQSDVMSHGEMEPRPTIGGSAQRRSLPLNYQQTLGPMSQQNYLQSNQDGDQYANQLSEGATSSQPVHGYEDIYWQDQQAEMTPDTFTSTLLPSIQHLKPYTISGWISSTYLQALIQKTDVLNDMFDHALDWNGDIQDWVVDNCKKSSPAVLARDLVFRLMTLRELERGIIWKMNMRSMPRTRLAAIRRCLKKQFPESFDNKEWKACLAYIRSSVTVLFQYRVPQVQDFWLMHQITNILGFCLCVSSGFNQLFSRWKEKRPLLLSAMFLLLLLNAGKTWDQNKVWLSREALFKSGVARMPHNAKVHYNYANYLKDTGKDLELAREHYRTAIRLNPEYISAHNNLGTILDNDTEAEGHFRTVLDKAPSHPGARVNLGNILFKRGEHEAGLQLLYKALEIDNSYLDALLSLGKAHTELENFIDAEKYLQKARDIAPENVQVYSHYGALMSKTGDHKRALFYYQKVLRMDQHHGETLVNAAVVYKQLGNTGQAESLLKQAVAIKRDKNSLEQLATFFFHSGRPQESLRLYEEIEIMAPNTTEMLVRYGNVLGSLNKLDKAESVFLRVLRQDEQNIDALVGLSILQSRQEKYHQSIEYLSSAIEISKADRKTERLKQLYFERGNNYKDLNLLSEALEDYIRTLELDLRHIKAHGNVGTIYHIWGDLEKAKTHYEAVLKIDPNNSIVKENLQKLNRIRH